MFPAFRRAAAGAAVALSIVAPPATAAISHVSVDATGPGGRSLIAPGDAVTLSETIANTGTSPINGALTGVLSSANTDVTDTTPRSFPTPLLPGQTTANYLRFAAHVPSTLSCGTPLNFSVALSGAATGNLSFTVPTGMAGTPAGFDSAPGAQTIPDDTTLPTESTVTVPTDGQIKDLSVHIRSLLHQDIGDLQVVLVGPDGTAATLMPRGQGSGADLTDAVFTAAGGVPIGAAPHTGTWLAPGLSAFVGRNQHGVWRLQVSDLVAGHPAGVLDGWTLDSSPPVCDAQASAALDVTPSTLAAGDTATLDASRSADPKGTLRNYHFDFGDRTAAADTGLTAQAPPHRYTVRGRYVATVTMQDANGVALAQRTAPVTVDQRPVVTLTGPATSPDIAAPVTVDASATHDPAGSIVHYEWDLNNDGVYETDGGTGPTSSVTFTFPAKGVTTSGDHVVRVRATDDIGVTDVATRTITVANRPPTAAFTAPAGYQATGRSVSLDGGASSDVDGSIAGYAWTYTGADGVAHPLAAGRTTTFVPPRADSFDVALTVTDDQGAAATVHHTILAADPPTVTVSAPPSLVARNAPVTLTATGSSASGAALTWGWDLAGGTAGPITGPTTRTVSFSAFGTYLVRVWATDDHALTTAVTVQIQVANQAPVASLAASARTVAPGAPVTFDASGSRDADGSIVEYRFDLDGDGAYEIRGTAATASASYPNPGHVDAHVQVVDNDGATATATVGVDIVTGAGTGGSTGSGSAPGADPASPLSPGVLVPAAAVTAPTPGSSSPAAPAGPGATPGATLTAALGGSTVQQLRRVLRSGVALTCAADRAATCTAVLTMRAADARRMRISSAAGSKPVVLGTATTRTAGAGTATMTVRIRPGIARRLGRARRLLLQASGTARDATGSTVRIARSLLVRG